MKDLFSITDKVAVVTGGSRGIGQMIAAAYLQNGAKVYISSRKEDACRESAIELANTFGGSCTAIPADLSTLEGIDAFVQVGTGIVCTLLILSLCDYR